MGRQQGGSSSSEANFPFQQHLAELNNTSGVLNSDLLRVSCMTLCTNSLLNRLGSFTLTLDVDWCSVYISHLYMNEGVGVLYWCLAGRIPVGHLLQRSHVCHLFFWFILGFIDSGCEKADRKHWVGEMNWIGE